ncbi:MAG: NAD(P)H-hydrate dehydratase, partial [Bacteroidetes bacterium]|nr:NAD(P)H-hydrate dehydratase [Bacteroidota bacterium]
IAAGGKGKVGAAVLSAKACLRSGVGLLTVFAPKSAVNIIHSALPEAMLQTSDEDEIIKGKSSIENYSSIGFGPGCGTEKETQSYLKQLIQDSQVPMVIDADGINILAENKTWLAFLKPNTILTPHPGEFFRLSGVKEVGINQIERASELAQRHSIIIVLKGARTAICLPDSRVFFNPTGNPGMAKGGSGDALTGLITGLLAQGYKPADASIIAVYLHGLAGDIAAQKFTEYAMITSDLISQIPEAFAMLHSGFNLTDLQEGV